MRPHDTRVPRRLIPLALILGAALAQTAPAPTPPVTRTGDVTLTRTRVAFPGVPAQDHVTATAAFLRSPATTAGSGARDVCSVQDFGSAGLPGAGSAPGASSPPPASLDAGTPLVLRSGSGPYTPLHRRTEGKRLMYAPPSPLLPAPPASLVLDIPGAKDGFPAFRNVEVPSLALPVLTAPGPDDALTVDTAFQWTGATRDAHATVMLAGVSDDADVMFSCFAQDDGNFALPAQTRAELRARGFETGSLTMVGRTAVRTVWSGDAVLHVRTFTQELRGGQ